MQLVVKDLEVQMLASVQVVQVACSPIDVVLDQLDFQLYFRLAEVGENGGGAAFVVDENDCDDDASGSFLAAGSFRERGSDHDSTGPAEY